MEVLEQHDEAVRRRVTLFLLFFSSDRCVAAASVLLSPGRVAFDLCRLWFDDIYVPSTRYMDGLKGDRSATDVQQFERAFSSDELLSLERFHAFLELRLDMLSDAHRRDRIFPPSDLWDNVMRDARYLAETLEPNHTQREALLSWLVSVLSDPEKARAALGASEGLFLKS